MQQELDELFHTHRLMCPKVSFPASSLQNSSSTNLRDLPRCFQTSASASSDLSDHVTAIIMNKSTPNSTANLHLPWSQVLKSWLQLQIWWANLPARSESFLRNRRQGEGEPVFGRHNRVPPSRARHCTLLWEEEEEEEDSRKRKTPGCLSQRHSMPHPCDKINACKAKAPGPKSFFLTKVYVSQPRCIFNLIGHILDAIWPQFLTPVTFMSSVVH